MISEHHARLFWNMVDKSGEDDCWNWRGCRQKDGYARVSYNRPGSGRGGQKIGRWLVHRLAYYLTHNEWPYPQANHSCDNPICCNPRHIVPGTQGDNMRQKKERNRCATGARNGARTHPERLRRGERFWSARLTKELVREIKLRNAAGESGAAIARALDVSTSIVYRVLTGKTWKHVK